MLTRCHFSSNLVVQLINNLYVLVCYSGYGEALSVPSPKEACVLRGDPC